MLCLLVLLLDAVLNACFAQSSSPDASKWSTWFIPNNYSANLEAAPNASQTLSEVKIVKQKTKELDEEKIRQIKYWNAGAPSYRWSQITHAMIPWDKFEIVGRMPSAWVSAAMYDATVIAWREKS